MRRSHTSPLPARSLIAPAALAASLAAGPAGAESPPSSWTVEALSGSSASVGTTLTVRQEGEPETEVAARWATRPFHQPFYWGVRIGRGSERGGWELELLHHKIYLENPTPEVSQFEITHGFNIATVQKTWIRRGWILRAGAGAVVAHAQSRVRGLSAGRGGDEVDRYELAGPAFQAGVGRRLRVTRHFFGTLEGKVTYGHARVSVARGKATTGNFAVHGLFGMGAAFP
jgi:hypothetical protein